MSRLTDISFPEAARNLALGAAVVVGGPAMADEPEDNNRLYLVQPEEINYDLQYVGAPTYTTATIDTDGKGTILLDTYEAEEHQYERIHTQAINGAQGLSFNAYMHETGCNDQCAIETVATITDGRTEIQIGEGSIPGNIAAYMNQYPEYTADEMKRLIAGNTILEPIPASLTHDESGNPISSSPDMCFSRGETPPAAFNNFPMENASSTGIGKADPALGNLEIRFAQAVTGEQIAEVPLYILNKQQGCMIGSVTSEDPAEEQIAKAEEVDTASLDPALASEVPGNTPELARSN